MLGFRGCRLPIVYPEIGDMQVRAIIEAAIEVKKRGKIGPARDHDSAGRHRRGACCSSRSGRSRSPTERMKKAGVKVEYLIGTMIEVPRAALTADQIAEEAEFFSFGTNDLTQMTFGFSRDDIKGVHADLLEGEDPAGRPVPDARRQGGRPARSRSASTKGRKARQEKHGEHLKVGICGEHGGDPDSVAFCHKVGMDYVSCSPFRVPIARLAAAQAALAGGQAISRDK